MKETIIRAILFLLFFLLLFFAFWKLSFIDSVVCAFVLTYILEGAVKAGLSK